MIRSISTNIFFFFFRALLRLLLGFICLSVSRSEQQRLALVPTNNEVECRPVDIQLYTWSGPGFESGECWHHGQHFAHGASWGRTDMPGSPYCLCEQGKVRIFYSQEQEPVVAEPLTILQPLNGTLPTSNDLAKWPISNYPTVRQRIVLCSPNRLGIRLRSRDGCFTCKCSKNGHWLCKRPASTTEDQNVEHPPQRLSRSYPYMDTYHAKLRVTSLRIRSECSLGSAPKYCILIERASSSNISRYIEIPRETSWIDRTACTRCSCTLDGHLRCEFLHPSCSRPCLLQKTRPVAIMYYFASGSNWLTPPNDKCRSCVCNNGERRCVQCDQIVRIDVSVARNENHERSAAIGEYVLLPRIIKATPCVLEINSNSHRLIFPGQQTWFEERCYFCSLRGDRLIRC